MDKICSDTGAATGIGGGASNGWGNDDANGAGRNGAGHIVNAIGCTTPVVNAHDSGGSDGDDSNGDWLSRQSSQARLIATKAREIVTSKWDTANTGLSQSLMFCTVALI